MHALIIAYTLTLSASAGFSQEPFDESLQGRSEDPTAYPLADINQRLDVLLRNIDLFELQLELYSENGASAPAVLDPARPDQVGSIKTELGDFLVRISNIEPYVNLDSPETNGYRLILEIGNLSPATYEGFTLAATWSGKDYVRLRSTQQTSDQTLLPGTWNPVSLTLPSTSPDEMVNVTIGLDVNSVSFPEVLDRERADPVDQSPPSGFEAPENTQALLDTLERYERAYREKSLAQLIAVYPSQPDTETVEAIFRTADSIQIDLAPIGEPRIDGDRAFVEAHRRIEQDGLAPIETRVTVELGRDGQGWIIVGIRLQ